MAHEKTSRDNSMKVTFLRTSQPSTLSERLFRLFRGREQTNAEE